MVASTVARETPALESLEAAISHSGKRDLQCPHQGAMNATAMTFGFW